MSVIAHDLGILSWEILLLYLHQQGSVGDIQLVARLAQGSLAGTQSQASPAILSCRIVELCMCQLGTPTLSVLRDRTSKLLVSLSLGLEAGTVSLSCQSRHRAHPVQVEGHRPHLSGRSAIYLCAILRISLT